jgi:hypothetical protein
MLGLISEPKPTAKAEPTEIDTTGPKLRSIKTVPDLHQKSHTTKPAKSPAESQYHSINPKAKFRKSTTKQRSLSAYSLPRSKSSTKMKKTSDNNNWHHTYKQLMNLDNWTCKTHLTQSTIECLIRYNSVHSIVDSLCYCGHYTLKILLV